MCFVFHYPVTMVKSHKKKCQNYFCVTTNDMVKCGCGQQEKMMDFDYLEEYLKGVNLWKAVTSLSEHFSLFAVV